MFGCDFYVNLLFCSRYEGYWVQIHDCLAVVIFGHSSFAAHLVNMSGDPYNMDELTQVYNPGDYDPSRNKKLPSGIYSVIEYQELQSLPDNSCYIPDLVPGEIQPLEDNCNVEELFKDINFEVLSQLMSQLDVAENSGPVDQKRNQSSEQIGHFHEPVSDDHVPVNTCKR